MAYVSQEMKKQITPAIKAVLKKYDMKGSVGIRHHSSLVVNLKQGPLNFEGVDNRGNDIFYAATDGNHHSQVNTYHIDKFYSGTTADFLNELVAAMKTPTDRGDWHDKSDAMTDYFDISYYVSVNVGKFDKGYIQTV
jgi:hypothetical protein